MEQKVKNIFNSLDEHGRLVGLPRLKGEKNKNYKQRLLDVGVHKANSSYDGLINGINRDLGLTYYDAMTIDISVPVSAGYVPSIVIDHATLTLYKDFYSETIDLEIELYDKNKTNSARKLSDVVSAILTSTHFTATLVDASKQDEDAIMLIHQDSNQEVFSETIPISNRFFLNNRDIINGTVSFSEIDVFHTKVSTQDLAIMNNGDYNINYETGEITVKSTPSGSGTVSYKYMDIPFSVIASPTVIKDTNDDVFKSRLFDQRMLPNGTKISELPTSEYVSIVEEVMAARALYWGK